MALVNATFKTGATWSSTGGTDETLVPDGSQQTSGVRLVVSGDTAVLTRRSVLFKVSYPQLAPNSASYAKLGRRSLAYRVPFIASDGKLYVQPINIEAAFHAEYAGSSVRLVEAAAMVLDTDFGPFWSSLLLS